MKDVNPFPIIAYSGPDYFCNREREASILRESLINGRNITLFSPRRIGKTGLIHHLFHSLKDENVMVMYTDMFGTENLDGFINKLANAVLRSLIPQKENFIEKAFKTFSRMRPRISYNAYTGIPEISFLLQTDEEKQSTLKEIFDLLERQEQTCFVAIDEFQQINRYPETNTEQILRSYIQHLKNTFFIFSGSQRHLLLPMFSSAKRPFYQSTGFLELDKLDKETYKGFISGHFRAYKQHVDDKELDFILEWTKTYTFYTQYLCNKIFSKRQPRISRSVIDECIREILAERESIFYNYRNLLSFHQYKLLSAIAMEELLTEPTGQNFIKKYDLSTAATVRKSLHALLEKELIYEKPGKKPVYQVYDVFLSRWFQMNYGSYR